MYIEDPILAFALEVAEHNRRLKEQIGLELMEISSDENCKIESVVKLDRIMCLNTHLYLSSTFLLILFDFISATFLLLGLR